MYCLWKFMEKENITAHWKFVQFCFVLFFFCIFIFKLLIEKKPKQIDWHVIGFNFFSSEDESNELLYCRISANLYMYWV